MNAAHAAFKSRNCYPKIAIRHRPNELLVGCVDDNIVSTLLTVVPLREIFKLSAASDDCAFVLEMGGKFSRVQKLSSPPLMRAVFIVKTSTAELSPIAMVAFSRGLPIIYCRKGKMPFFLFAGMNFLVKNEYGEQPIPNASRRRQSSAPSPG